GTTMRLLMGVLAASPFPCRLIGDESLGGRPMERVAVPLRAMGASVHTDHGHPPVEVHGGPLRGAHHELAEPTAQVKGAILLAGIAADGQTTVVEPARTRDHTERALRRLGAPVGQGGAARDRRGARSRGHRGPRGGGDPVRGWCGASGQGERPAGRGGRGDPGPGRAGQGRGRGPGGGGWRAGRRPDLGPAGPPAGHGGCGRGAPVPGGVRDRRDGVVRGVLPGLPTGPPLVGGQGRGGLTWPPGWWPWTGGRDRARAGGPNGWPGPWPGPPSPRG